MTPKQVRFVQEYLIDLNATQAAIRAGYSERTAHAQGPRLLENVGVREAIAAAQQTHAERTGETVEKITDELNRAFVMAEQQERPDRMVMAAVAKAKLNGLIVEKSESTLTHRQEDRVKRREEAIARRRAERANGANGHASPALH